MCDARESSLSSSSACGRTHSPSPSPEPNGKRRRSLGGPLQEARQTVKDRHWLPCGSCASDPSVDECVAPETDSWQKKCKRCREMPNIHCDSSIWMDAARLRIFRESIEDGADVEVADQAAYGSVPGLLGGPLDKCKEYSFLAAPSSMPGTRRSCIPLCEGPGARWWWNRLHRFQTAAHMTMLRLRTGAAQTVLACRTAKHRHD